MFQRIKQLGFHDQAYRSVVIQRDLVFVGYQKHVKTPGILMRYCQFTAKFLNEILCSKTRHCFDQREDIFAQLTLCNLSSASEPTNSCFVCEM